MSGKDKQQEQTIAKDLVVLRSLVEASSSGVLVLSLCEKDDAIIMVLIKKIFKKKIKMKKGIAFPTRISVNNCVCHFSPLKSDQDYSLKEGDLVKIDLGVHVDGFIANVAYTLVVDVAQGTQVTGGKADVIKAIHLCDEAVLCLVKPGNQNTQVTEALNKAAHSLNCIKNHIQNLTDQQKKDHEKAELAVHEVYAVDVLVSSGEGKDPSKQHGLKMKTSRAFFSEVEKCFDKKAQMGVVKYTKHELLQLFNVLYEKEGEFVAQFKCTVLLMPSGLMQITSGPLEPDLYKSEMEVQDAELKALLQCSASQKTQKKKKKREKATSGETLEENEAGD
uniref:Peptidase M24 domain-containing protein n=1 Tax=Nomascus leucogenys TaxID=61853 RepID=A0A2I3H9B1_NOMLE